VLYRYRTRLSIPDRLRVFIPNYSRDNYAPLSTFSDQAAAGMTSSTFDIEADNIFQGDTRAGLDEQGTREVMEIMRRENVKYGFALFVVSVLTPPSPPSFDQARLIRHHRYLAANSIDPSGEPPSHTIFDLLYIILPRYAPRCKGGHTFVMGFMLFVCPRAWFHVYLSYWQFHPDLSLR
jgi:Fungal protein of unknown function (DUF2015)